MNSMFSFAAFNTARVTVCVIRYSHLASQGVEIQSLVMDFDIQNNVWLIKHLFTSLLQTYVL